MCSSPRAKALPVRSVMCVTNCLLPFAPDCIIMSHLATSRRWQRWSSLIRCWCCSSRFGWSFWRRSSSFSPARAA